MPGLLKSLEVGARRLLFRFSQSLITTAEVLPSVPSGYPLARILIMRQDRIGDMIMTIPLLRRLREVHPEAEIGIVASGSNSRVLEHEEGMTVFTCRKGPVDFVDSMIQVRDFSPDAAVDMHMHDSTTSFLYAMASGARWRLHVHRNDRLPFNVRVNAPQDGHIIEAFAGLLSGLGRRIDLDGMDREIRTSEEEEEFARHFWEASDPRPGDCAAVNISAGGPNRDWGEDRYIEICTLLRSMGLVPLIVSSPEDRGTAVSICRGLEGALLSPATPTILHLSALLRGVVLLVSPDTSVIHLAASLGIPVVGMYLPFDPSLPKWYPWDVLNRVVMSPGSESLAQLDAGEVASAIRDVVKRIM